MQQKRRHPQVSTNAVKSIPHAPPHDSVKPTSGGSAIA